MGSMTASADNAGTDFLNNLLAVMMGGDGLVGAFFGSLGGMIGVTP